MRISSHSITLIVEEKKSIVLSKKENGDVTMTVGDIDGGYQQADTVYFGLEHMKEFIHVLKEITK